MRNLEMTIEICCFNFFFFNFVNVIHSGGKMNSESV